MDIKAKFLSSMFFHVDCHKKILPRLRVGLPISNNLIKKTSHRHTQKLGMLLIADVVMFNNHN